MKQYLDLLHRIRTEGVKKYDRTTALVLAGRYKCNIPAGAWNKNLE